MNKEDFFKKYWPILVYGIIAVTGLILFMSCVATKSAKRLAEIEHEVLPKGSETLAVDSVNAGLLYSKDTVIYVSDYKARVAAVDSLYSDMYRLSERYREETSILIDKTAAWMGFWIAMICMITGVFALIQHFNSQSEIEKLNRLKEVLNTWQKDLEKKNKEMENSWKCREKEHEIFSIAQCMHVLPDSELINNDALARQIVFSYHKHLSDRFTQLVVLIKKKDEIEESEFQQIRIILAMVRNSINKAQSIITDSSLAVSFFKLNTLIKELINDCYTGEINQSNIKDHLTKLNTEMIKTTTKLQMTVGA